MPSDQTPAQTWVEPKHGTYNAYANFVNALWTPHDIKLKFGELTKMVESPDSTKTFIIEEQASITLTWSEAKILQGMLSDIIGRFEKLNGEITTPKIPQSAPIERPARPTG